MPSDRPQVRAFLSSTFSDFHEERDLLAKQVFPALRQRAKGRGMEVVDVDLRWGITEEQSQQGQTLPICLAEIDRCRPYFIGLLGDRYGWVPEPDQYSPELLERQGWLREHQGGASVTELEILHGVLNNPEMAGRAFFYFRDPAYSTARAEAGQPGWRSEGETECQKLEALKRRIRASGFPVVEDLADPQAIAERIEADLWALIEQQFPEGEKPDALAIEAARHASYRADRTGLYLGGEGYIQRLEQWIDAGEQRLLITGDSGSGKSALIANWMAAHEQSHPEDVIYSHHLGCSNDANAVRPLLARLIDTAAQLLGEQLEVPEELLELEAKVGEIVARLSVWARRRGCRWIWVLDGLDKLSAEDQQALSWLPLTIPEGIHVVTSALECPARTILQERNYRSLAIGPLQRPEQEALIDRYLRIFARQMDSGLKEHLLAHPLAGSPLFLRVLLEELRQCGRFDTLKQQLDVYLSAQTIDDLYERVLERLEQDGHGESVQKALTALWASLAGLSEPELLAITGLTPAAWAPIGIGLQAALGENQGRLVFGHDFLRIAVQDRYLPTKVEQRREHARLSDFFKSLSGHSENRKYEELPWQLMRAQRPHALRKWLLNPWNLAHYGMARGSYEALECWRFARKKDDERLDLIISGRVHEFIRKSYHCDDFILVLDSLASILDHGGMYGTLLLELRHVLVDYRRFYDDYTFLIGLIRLVREQARQGYREKAHKLAVDSLALARHKLSDLYLASVILEIAQLVGGMGRVSEVLALYEECLEIQERVVGATHPEALATTELIAQIHFREGRHELGRSVYQRCIDGCQGLFGHSHVETMEAIMNFAVLELRHGHPSRALPPIEKYTAWCQAKYGTESLEHLESARVLASALRKTGSLQESELQFRAVISLLEGMSVDTRFLMHKTLCGLALTLEQSNKLDEALHIIRKGLRIGLTCQESGHRWWLNSSRLDMVRILHKLDRHPDALALLEDLQTSLNSNPDQDDDDRKLLSDAAKLRGLIEIKP